ncbi:MAG: hypothetical protein DMG31_08460 [Acidobacteria bacterium]|nr:MAG: hypothetical protein DMG31_08460 [Acidobacteriota bacterium]
MDADLPRPCRATSDGRDAIGKAKQIKPDIAILDIRMPLLNGLEAAAQSLQVPA